MKKVDLVIFLSLSFFILFVLYIAFFLPITRSQLISDRYYEDEIKYQSVIEGKKNLYNLNDTINIYFNNNGIEILLPNKHKNNELYGFYSFIRYSSKNLDLKKYFYFYKKQEKKIIIPKKLLKKGYYKFIIRWNSLNKRYFFEKNIFY